MCGGHGGGHDRGGGRSAAGIANSGNDDLLICWIASCHAGTIKGEGGENERTPTDKRRRRTPCHRQPRHRHCDFSRVFHLHFFFDIDRSLLIIERGTCCEARACSKCRVVPRHDARCPLGLGRRKKSGDGGGEREEDVSKQNYQVKLNKVNICHETGNLCI
jgi:hypothetical protein